MAKDDELLVSYAQHGEDIVLWRAFSTQDSGTYIDVGAYHPTTDSVTRFFYERGWRGINIDPSASAIEQFQRERPEDINLHIAAGDQDGELEFFVCDNPGWSTTNPVVAAGLEADGRIVERLVVPARRLSSVLDELPERTIDFLKIDAEGAEEAVLRGVDFDRHRPRVVVVEAVAPVIANTGAPAAAKILERNRYLHAGFDGLNNYFTDEADLVPALYPPANPTDNFVRHDTLEMLQQLKYFNDREPEIRALDDWARDLAERLAAMQAPKSGYQPG